MVHVAVNKYDFEKINILEYAFGEGGGGHQKAYAVYAFINVDNYERPLTCMTDHNYAIASGGCGQTQRRSQDFFLGGGQFSVISGGRPDSVGGG